MEDETDVNGLYISSGVNFKPFKDPTPALHDDCDYIDEGAGEEDVDFSRSSECCDWRKSAAQFRDEGMVHRPDFSRFFTNDWRTERVAAKHLKFCPGDKCRQWLGLHHFAANNNMSDNLDVYCISCNQAKRNERMPHRSRPMTTDKYEMFVKAYREATPALQPDNTREMAISREVNKRITDAANYARTRYKKKFAVDNIEITRKLFQGGRHFCNVTGQALTPECFLEHHTLTFQLNHATKRIEIICSQSRKA